MCKTITLWLSCVGDRAADLSVKAEALTYSDPTWCYGRLLTVRIMLYVLRVCLLCCVCVQQLYADSTWGVWNRRYIDEWVMCIVCIKWRSDMWCVWYILLWYVCTAQDRQIWSRCTWTGWLTSSTVTSCPQNKPSTVPSLFRSTRALNVPKVNPSFRWHTGEGHTVTAFLLLHSGYVFHVCSVVLWSCSQM